MPVPVQPAKPRRGIGGLVLTVAVMAAATVAIVMIATHPRVPAPWLGGGGGVSIRVIAHEPTEVSIDGHAAGKTPLTVQRPKATQPIVIAAPHATKQVIPDHDQVVDLSPP
jgi:hypothetical protein